MKNLIKPFILFLALTGIGAQAQNNKDQQNALVEKVLNNMVKSNTMSVSTYISPAYLALHDVKASDYKVNTYSPSGFSVDENKGNGIVVSRIWGSNRSWVHRLTFMITYENGSYYCMPGSVPSEYGYIDPWMKVEANIVDDGGGSGGEGKPSETEAREIVSDLLYDMVNDADNFGKGARKYIAPSYYKKERIDKYDYQINYYSPVGSAIIEVKSNGMVVTQIWGEDKGWIHELTFKVVKENGGVYVYPSGHTDNYYIHPWYEVETDVKERTPQKQAVKGNEKTELVEKILDNMVNDPDDNFGTEMRLYIAPSYYKDNDIDPFVYLVNAYSPSGFSIESVSGNIVKAKIWGSGRSWVHELTFKVVEEDGLLYVMPGQHYTETEYVDPWYSVRTDVE